MLFLHFLCIWCNDIQTVLSLQIWFMQWWQWWFCTIKRKRWSSVKINMSPGSAKFPYVPAEDKSLRARVSAGFTSICQSGFNSFWSTSLKCKYKCPSTHIWGHSTQRDDHHEGYHHQMLQMQAEVSNFSRNEGNHTLQQCSQQSDNIKSKLWNEANVSTIK